jgi:hypothetical protein
MTTPTTPMTADDVLAVIADAGKFLRAAKVGTELDLAHTAVAAVYDERDALQRRGVSGVRRERAGVRRLRLLQASARRP